MFLFDQSLSAQIVDFVFIHNWRGVKGTLLRISISLCLVLHCHVLVDCTRISMFN
jgi:hypothetical protein